MFKIYKSSIVFSIYSLLTIMFYQIYAGCCLEIHKVGGQSQVKYHIEDACFCNKDYCNGKGSMFRELDYINGVPVVALLVNAFTYFIYKLHLQLFF